MIKKILGRFVVSLAAFTVGAVGVLGMSMAVSASGEDKAQPVVTTDRETAENSAGYDIVEPGNMPEGMELKAYIVDGTKRSNKSDSVDQYWRSSGDASAKQWISVMQGPRAGGLLNGTAATISGIEGQRVRYESVDGRDYPIVELMWPNEGGFLYVSGSITGAQTEDTLMQVAASLISR